ncbi:MAG: hypothetical protein D3924_12955 [Candidatus Electrothrix sp. AR4]|nr:hypothetical protein [Candidatus Electrothrix sp. AR4]
MKSIICKIASLILLSVVFLIQGCASVDEVEVSRSEPEYTDSAKELIDIRFNFDGTCSDETSSVEAAPCEDESTNNIEHAGNDTDATSSPIKAIASQSAGA